MGQNSFNEVFSKRLRHYLEANSMTQAELAKRLGVGTTSVHNWCAGIKSPRMDKVDKMCEIFYCTRTDFMIEEGTTPPRPVHLTTDQRTLLTNYVKLNNTGRQKALDYVADLTEQEKYTQDGEAKKEGLASA